MTALEQVEETQFGGLYRGVVLSNTDPQGNSRVQVKVPALNGEGPLGWAMPCYPFPAVDVALPPVGAPVWVMFEHGSIDFPVYLGTWRI